MARTVGALPRIARMTSVTVLCTTLRTHRALCPALHTRCALCLVLHEVVRVLAPWSLLAPTGKGGSSAIISMERHRSPQLTESLTPKAKRTINPPGTHETLGSMV